jgi:hypothetical protein
MSEHLHFSFPGVPSSAAARPERLPAPSRRKQSTTAVVSSLGSISSFRGWCVCQSATARLTMRRAASSGSDETAA